MFVDVAIYLLLLCSKCFLSYQKKKKKEEMCLSDYMLPKCLPCDSPKPLCVRSGPVSEAFLSFTAIFILQSQNNDV